MPATVLIVEDSMVMRTLLVNQLTKRLYRVFAVETGHEASKILKKHSVDLILLDVVLPDTDGITLCRSFHKDKDTAHIPVILMTVLTDRNSRLKGLEAGATDFLAKPIRVEALLARVRSHLRVKILEDEGRERIKTTLLFQNEEQSNLTKIISMDKAHVALSQTLMDNAKVNALLHSFSCKTYSLENLPEDGIDVFLLDYRDNHRLALDICANLRSSSQYRHTPILGVCHSNDYDDVEEFLDRGGNDILNFPFDSSEFFLRLRTQISHKRYQNQLENIYKQGEKFALTDRLTGLYNRRYWETHVERLIEEQKTLKEAKKPLSVAIVDLDNFKTINDTLGHDAGDKALEQLANIMRQNLRSTDLLARYGGDEFTILFPDADLAESRLICEGLCRRIEKKALDLGTLVYATVSIGVAQYQPMDTQASLLKRADKALYQSKGQHKNQVQSL